MDEAAFWRLIDKARGAWFGAASPRRASAEPDRLAALLAKESDETVAAFGQVFNRQMARLYRWDVWGAAYVINGGASDDGFQDFCEWLVGKGRAAFEQALTDPDGLGRFIDTEEPAENEGLGAVANGILEERRVPEEDSPFPDKPEGEPFDEETVEAAYPRLAQRFA